MITTTLTKCLILFLAITALTFAQGRWYQARDVSYLGLRELVVLGDGGVYVASFEGLFRAEGDSLFWREVYGRDGEYHGLVADRQAPSGMVRGGGQFSLYRTEDGGQTWAHIGGAVGNNIHQLHAGAPGIFYVICSPDGIIRVGENQGSKRIISGLRDDWWGLRGFASFGDARSLLWSYYGNVFYSSNHGDTWTLGSTGLEGKTVIDIHTEGNTAWAATQGHGVMRAVSPVTTWQSAATGLGVEGDPSMSVRLLARDPQGPLIALTEAGFYSSSDKGDSWNAFGAQLPNWFAIKRFLIHPDGRFFMLYGKDSVLVSTDRGQSWELSRKGMHFSHINDVQIHAGTLVVAGADCVFQSVNQAGTEWHQQIVGLQDPRVAKLLIRQDSTILAFDIHGGVSEWRRLTEDWRPLGSGLPGEVVRSTATSQGGLLFAGTVSGRVFRSSDGGLMWSEVFRSPLQANVVSLYCMSDTTVFAGTFGNGLFRSQDGGISWQPIAGGMSHPNVTAVVSAPDGDVYAGTYGLGVFRSTDLGNSWTSISSGLENLYVTSLVCNRIGVLAAGTYGSGVFQTRNNGGVWIQSTDGMENARVIDLRLEPHQQVIAVLEGGQIWYSIGFMPTSAEAPPAPMGFHINTVYPNPFPATTTIAFETHKPEIIRISLCDMLGREISCVHDGHLDPGKHEIPVQADNLPAGTYVIRVLGSDGPQQRIVTHLRSY